MWLKSSNLVVFKSLLSLLLTLHSFINIHRNVKELANFGKSGFLINGGSNESLTTKNRTFITVKLYRA